MVNNDDLHDQLRSAFTRMIERFAETDRTYLQEAHEALLEEEDVFFLYLLIVPVMINTIMGTRPQDLQDGWPAKRFVRELALFVLQDHRDDLDQSEVVMYNIDDPAVLARIADLTERFTMFFRGMEG